jgi:molybdopterin molybdotransferase
MVRTLPLGLDEALALTLDNIQPLGTQHVGLLDGLMRGAAEALCAKVDSPSIDASMKDGFAVISAEVAGASKVSPVVLTLAGSMAAAGKRMSGSIREPLCGC